MKRTDQELVLKAKAGDNSAFGEIWERYERQVLATCRRHLTSPNHDPATDEHDLATEAFIRALHNLDCYDDRSELGIGFDAWICEIAKRVCLNSLTKQRRRAVWLAPLPPVESERRGGDVEQLANSRMLLRFAAQEINALPAIYRAAFKLRLEELSHQEIARAIGVSADTAAKRVQRARNLLRPKLAGWLDESGSSLAAGHITAPVQRIEAALTEIVGDHRIAAIALPSGGEVQLCLRVDRRRAEQETEIESRRAELAIRPRAWRRRLELADICYQSGRWDEAREELRTTLRVNPSCFAASLRLTEMLLQEQKQSEAATICESALRMHPPIEIQASLKANRSAALGNDEDADSEFVEAIRLSPKNKANYRGLNDALGRLSRYENQLENLAALREVDPNDLYGYVQVYTPCARLHRFDIAQALLEKAVALDPNDPMAVKHLFQVRMNLGLCDSESLAIAEQLVRLAPDLADSWSELATIYHELDQQEKSIAVLERFACDHPNNAQALAMLAWRYIQGSREEEGAASTVKAYDLAPNDYFVCWSLLMAHGHSIAGESESRTFEMAVEIERRFAKDSFILSILSEFYRYRGRHSRALDLAKLGIAICPSSSFSYNSLASLHLHCGQWQEAADTYWVGIAASAGRYYPLLVGHAEALSRMNDSRAPKAWARAEETITSADECLYIASRYLACGLSEAAASRFLKCLKYPVLPPRVRRLVEEALASLGISAPPPTP